MGIFLQHRNRKQKGNRRPEFWENKGFQPDRLFSTGSWSLPLNSVRSKGNQGPEMTFFVRDIKVS
jgi:hypothetical protein